MAIAHYHPVSGSAGGVDRKTEPAFQHTETTNRQAWSTCHAMIRVIHRPLEESWHLPISPLHLNTTKQLVKGQLHCINATHCVDLFDLVSKANRPAQHEFFFF